MKEKNFNTQTLRVYESDYQSFLARWDKGPYKPPALLLETTRKIPAESRILDLGCGGAQDTRHLKREGYGAVGLDLSANLLAHARRKSRATPLVRASLRNLPFQSEIFDAVWAAAVLIHFPKNEVLSLLRGIRLSLRLNGIFSGTFTFGTRSGISRNGWLPGRYFSRWKKEELAENFQQAGYEVEQLTVVSNRERKGRWLNLIARKR